MGDMRTGSGRFELASHFSASSGLERAERPDHLKQIVSWTARLAPGALDATPAADKRGSPR